MAYPNRGSFLKMKITPDVFEAYLKCPTKCWLRATNEPSAGGPFHVGAYIEQMPGSKPTIKQKLAAIRMLYDFLVIRQLVPVNPTASVRGPKYVVKRGKTPVWSREDAKKLLESIPRDDLAGLRDRALISTMLFSFARISAVLSLKRQDFYYQGPRRWLRFHEKGEPGARSIGTMPGQRCGNERGTRGF